MLRFYYTTLRQGGRELEAVQAGQSQGHTTKKLNDPTRDVLMSYYHNQKRTGGVGLLDELAKKRFLVKSVFFSWFYNMSSILYVSRFFATL